MIRKLLLVAAAIAMPLGAVAVTGITTAGVAGAATTCSVAGTVTFAAPGISHNGAAGPSKTSTTTTSGTTFGGGCTGGSPAMNITSKSTKCDKHTAGLPSSNPACTPGNYGYGSWANFASGGTAAIQKSLKKLSFTLNGTAFKTKTTGASVIGCPGSEAGFKLVGTVSSPKADKGQTSTLSACLGVITGTGLNPGDNFGMAALDQIGTVQTAQIDPATSTVTVG